MRNAFVVATLLTFLMNDGAHSQERRIEIGGHLAVTSREELETTDLGFGGRFGFQATPILAIEGELSFYPSDAPGDIPVTRSRLEGLFGIKAGPRFERFAVFGKLRPGFVRFADAPGPVACIAIFPPPLNCVLAEGRTVFALDLGGGVEIYPTERGFVRVDVSNLLLEYPGPAFSREGRALADKGSWDGNLRLTFGAGLRF
jgi:hypothetical protein